MEKKSISYSEKLKNPRWQKRRLDILTRDNFKCASCGESEKILHVHHKTYTYGNDPWDYPDSNLITLCERCHESEEFYKNEIKGAIHDILQMGGTNKIILDCLQELGSKLI
jgi:5-methylcytosine-specific restriction endonuclease McrA